MTSWYTKDRNPEWRVTILKYRLANVCDVCTLSLAQGLHLKGPALAMDRIQVGRLWAILIRDLWSRESLEILCISVHLNLLLLRLNVLLVSCTNDSFENEPRSDIKQIQIYHRRVTTINSSSLNGPTQDELELYLKRNQKQKQKKKRKKKGIAQRNSIIIFSFNLDRFTSTGPSVEVGRITLKNIFLAKNNSDE